MLHHSHNPWAGRVSVLLQVTAMGLQVGLQPIEGLLPQPGALLVIEASGVLALPAPGQGSGAGGVVAVPRREIVAQPRHRGKSLAIETGGGGVKLLEGLLAERGEHDALIRPCRSCSALQDQGQFLLGCLPLERHLEDLLFVGRILLQEEDFPNSAIASSSRPAILRVSPRLK